MRLWVTVFNGTTLMIVAGYQEIQTVFAFGFLLLAFAFLREAFF